jgi:hypothetical protein
MNTAHEAATNSDTPAQDRSISLLRANFVMVVFALPAILLPGLVWYAVWGLDGIATLFRSPDTGIILLLALGVGVVVHEGLHALAWARAARLPLRAIRFGFDWKTITPYAHCTVPITARAYRIGAATPLLAIGVLPAIISLFNGDAALLAFSLFFIFAAGGDMLILWLIRDVHPDALVEDHPTRAGCLVRTKEHAAGAFDSD